MSSRLKTKVDRLRDEALCLLREDEALAFVISPAGRDGREMAERNRIALQSGTRQSLQRYIDSARQQLRERRRSFGVTASADELIAFLEVAESVPKGQVALPFLAALHGFFRDYSRVWPNS